MDSFKVKLKLIKIFGVIVILILIGVGLSYYGMHREEEKLPPTPSVNKPSSTDSVARLNHESAPAEMSAKPEVNPKNGSVKIVEEFIKSNAKNPASFEFLEWSEVSAESGYWKVRCKYKGSAPSTLKLLPTLGFIFRTTKLCTRRSSRRFDPVS